jgi:hypothetical protein
MKIKFSLLASALVLCGCSTGIVPTGGNTYMIGITGSTLTHETSLKAECYKQASAFCAARNLVMVPVSTSGRDGNPVPFGKGASCELIFKAVPPGSPEAVQPTIVPETPL